ncbi:putative movement protein [Anagyris vein yellowing virus]|uniref:Putative movement protein n=1 Tax=Anagyris vein yellowing virus TaxID=312275 RepID=Q3BD94_9VIRU|nr:putative movement protein [Anagyris vein yellowing virus]AAW88528.1 putative movement protein [Anagyris vein yellowing virus]
MSHVVPVSPRCSVIDCSQGRIPQSSLELSCSTSPILSHSVPLDHPKGTHSFSDCVRNPFFGFRLHPSPPRSPQGDRNVFTLQSLESPGISSIHRDVYEAIKVQEAVLSQSELHRADQLSSNRRRLCSLPHHLSHPSNKGARVHARRSNVLHTSTSAGSVHQGASSSAPSLLSRGSPREQLHRSLPLPQCVHLHNFGQLPALRARRAPRRKLQPATHSFKLVENLSDKISIPKSVSESPGILGPMPLHPHPKRPPPPQRKQSGNNLLQDSRLPRASRGHLPPPTSPAPARAKGSVRLPLHVHKSSAHSPHLRPSWVRKNSLQQASICLGHSTSVGQSSDLRSPQLPHPPKSHLRLLPKSPGQVQAVPITAPSPLLGGEPSILGPHPSNSQAASEGPKRPKSGRIPLAFPEDKRSKRPIKSRKVPARHCPPAHKAELKAEKGECSSSPLSGSRQIESLKSEARAFLPKNLPEAVELALIDNYCFNFGSFPPSFSPSTSIKPCVPSDTARRLPQSSPPTPVPPVLEAATSRGSSPVRVPSTLPSIRVSSHRAPIDCTSISSCLSPNCDCGASSSSSSSFNSCSSSGSIQCGVQLRNSSGDPSSSHSGTFKFRFPRFGQ